VLPGTPQDSFPMKGRSAAFSKEALEAAVARVDGQLDYARANKAKLEERCSEYDDLESLLGDLPKRLTHPVMVPFGPLAFFEGYLEHTNEVLTQLSSEYFVLRTVPSSLGLVRRRKEQLQKHIADVDRELNELSMRRRLAAQEGASTSSPGGIRSGKEASVNVDADGFLDIREPIDDEDNDTAMDPVTRSDQGVWTAQVENNSSIDGIGANTQTCDDAGMLAKLRELEQLEDSDLAMNDSVSGPGRKASALDCMGNSDSSQICGDNGMMARLRELERLEELRELEELDNELEQTGDIQHNESGDGSCESSLPALPTASSSAPVLCSPADLFRVMQRVEESTATSAPAPSTSDTSRAEKAGNSAKISSGSAVEACVAGGIHERTVDAAAASPPGGFAADSGRLPAEEPAPRRISKFKADRARSRQG